MKIAVLGIRGFPNVMGGPETHSENLYPIVVQKGNDVTVYARKGYVDPSLQEYKGVKLRSLFCVRNKFLEAFLHTLFGVFAALKLHPDILHIHAVGPSLFVPLARLFRFRVVITLHGPDYERKKWGRLAKLVLRLGEHFGSRWANAVICVSQSLAERIRTKYRREAIFIPNGVTIMETLHSKTTLQKYGLEARHYVITVGRFSAEKGFEDFIDAFTEFQKRECNSNKRISNWKLVIVGSAIHEDKYSRLVQLKAQQNPSVVLTGFLSGNPLRELYSNAALFVLPSYSEGLPIVLLEAMSYGLSYIVSDIKAHREMGLPDDRFFIAGDIEGMASKMKEFINKPLGKEGKSSQIRMIAEKYDWHKIADRTIEVFFSA